MTNFAQKCTERDTFTFLIGIEKTKYNVHPTVLKDISPPLYNLVTNGQMEESIKRVAELPHIEEHTFGRFCEYAYSAPAHNMCTKFTHNVKKELWSIPPDLSEFWCRTCRDQCKVDIIDAFFPYCSFSCQQIMVDPEGSTAAVCVGCGNDYLGPCTTAPLFCEICEKAWIHDITDDSRFSIDFIRLGDCVSFMSYREVKKQFEFMFPLDHPDDNLCTYAKVYMFADMYLANQLKELCLYKLHKKLLDLELDRDTIEEVIEFLAYTYQNTSNNDDGTIGTGSALRHLARVYATDTLKLLVPHEDFRMMLNEGGPLVSDLMTSVADKLPY